MPDPISEAILNVVSQLPIVAILWYWLMKSTEHHKEATEYYRDQLRRYQELTMRIVEMVAAAGDHRAIAQAAARITDKAGD